MLVICTDQERRLCNERRRLKDAGPKTHCLLHVGIQHELDLATTSEEATIQGVKPHNRETTVPGEKNING